MPFFFIKLIMAEVCYNKGKLSNTYGLCLLSVSLTCVVTL